MNNFHSVLFLFWKRKFFFFKALDFFQYICKKNLKNKDFDYRLYELIPDYELLKEELLKFWEKQLFNDINKNYIAFGAGTMGILRNIH